MSKFDSSGLRQAYSQFPTGVTVVTTRAKNEKPVGITVSSFNTVSIEPPLILWSISKSAHSLEVFKNCEYFAVNVLNDEQMDLSNCFASKNEDKFAGLDYSNGVGECPLLSNALAHLNCKLWNVYEGGDHLIIVGEVIDYQLSEGKPLVYSQGGYARVSQHKSTTE